MNVDRDAARPDLASVRLLAMDVDGVLTDGTIAYDDRGGETKRFDVTDGMGLATVRLAGVRVAWISGRSGWIVERRARELGVDRVAQGARDKGRSLLAIMAEFGLTGAEVAYVGDDWNDLPAFDVVGVRIAVANAAEEVLNRADIVTRRRGGQGAIREVCTALLAARQAAPQVLSQYLASLRESSPDEPYAQ